MVLQRQSGDDVYPFNVTKCYLIVFNMFVARGKICKNEKPLKVSGFYWEGLNIKNGLYAPMINMVIFLHLDDSIPGSALLIGLQCNYTFNVLRAP